MNRTGVLRCAVAALLFGVSAPAAAQLTGDMGAFVLAGLLYVGAALAVAPVVARPSPGRPALSAATLRAAGGNLALAVVLGGSVGPVLLAAGLGLVPAATSSLLLNLELVLTTLVAGLVYREHIGRAVATGTALVLAGSVVLGWSGRPDARWGALLVAGACLCWAVDNSATASIEHLTPAQITLVKGVVAGGTNLAIGLVTTEAPAVGPALGALAIGAIGYGASITLWVSGARLLGAARAQLVFAGAPFVGALVAWLAFGDEVTGRALVAFALGAVGVASVLRSAHTHTHVHEATVHLHDGERHEHEPVTHAHPHVPDLHHRHEHGGGRRAARTRRRSGAADRGGA